MTGVQQLVDIIMYFPTPCLSLEFDLDLQDLLIDYKEAVKLIFEAMKKRPFMRFDVTLYRDFLFDKFRIKRSLAMAFLVSEQVVGLALQVTGEMLNDLLLVFEIASVRGKNGATVIRLEGGRETGAYNRWGADLIADILRKDRHLLYLDASEAQLDMSHKALLEAKFYKALQSSKLCSLKMKSSGLETQTAVAIAEVLSGHKTLQLLDLSFNNLGDVGVIAIAQSLTSNTALKYLVLNKVEISSKGGCALANALRENECLELCYLQDDELGADTGKNLASMLTQNVTLKFLILSHCALGPDGCKAFVSALKQNRTLTHLIISHCGAAAVDKPALVEAAVEGQTLKALELKGINELGKSSPYELAQFCQFYGAYRRHLLAPMVNRRKP